jgi:hypothetical protein
MQIGEIDLSGKLPPEISTQRIVDNPNQSMISLVE